MIIFFCKYKIIYGRIIYKNDFLTNKPPYRPRDRHPLPIFCQPDNELEKLAVTYLTEILENAKVEQHVKPKQNNENQNRFSEMILMEYDKNDFGKIKLTVGVLKGSKGTTFF
jgi:hypothetical protein